MTDRPAPPAPTVPADRAWLPAGSITPQCVALQPGSDGVGLHIFTPERRRDIEPGC